MPFGTKRAGLLERSLQGHPSPDEEIRNLVATVGRIPALTSPACAPRDEFVSALGIQLRAEALTLPAREARRVSSAAVARRSTGRPVVFVVGQGLPRVLAGATASLLIVGAVVGGTSRSALPGGLLYPVKQLLNSAAAQLAGSDFDRGMTLLSQAQEHISDASALVARDGAQADPASVDEALLSAFDAVSDGQRALLGEFDRTSDAQALIALNDFAVRALPQLDALRLLVPADSKPDVDALIALLQESRISLARKAAACGQPCASLGGATLGSSPLSAPNAGVPSSPNIGGLPIPGGVPTASGVPNVGGVPVPGPKAAITGPGGVVVGPSVAPFPITTGGTIAPEPTVIIGSLTIAPSPIVIPPIIPPIVIPPIVIPSVPLLTSVTTILPTALPPILPTGLLGLP